MPEEQTKKEDIIKSILFYANKYDDKYFGKKLKSKLEETLTYYKNEYQTELESFLPKEENIPTLELEQYDKEKALLGEIMTLLNTAVSYDQNNATYVTFVNRLKSAISDPVSLQKGNGSIESIIIGARGIINHLEEQKNRKRRRIKRNY